MIDCLSSSVQSAGNQERLDTMEEIPHNKLKYLLCYEETYISNNFLLAIWEQMAIVVGCAAMRRPQQPLLLEPREVEGASWSSFAIAFQEILGWLQLVNY